MKRLSDERYPAPAPGRRASDQRQTIRREVGVEGIGLHTGRPIRLRLVPAAPMTGIVFRRVDAGGAEVPARVEHAGRSFYATVLEAGGTTVSTVEHLLAALYALRVDDVLVELDGPEVPILDGSATPFVELVARAGRVEHAVDRDYLTLVRSVVIEDMGKRIAAYPAPEYRVTYAIDFDHPLLGHQELSASLWDETAFVRKVAPARTFTFEHEVAMLRARGLALGGSLDNAVVIGDSGVLNSELRFPDEFVRHKMLDLTGDLALLGHPLRAHVVAFRAGHDLHARLARRIWDSRDSWYLAPWLQESSAVSTTAR
jgi:UDP-3-O-[3-hydroxymyristoyl] N-acetylglucosamine deacetylase